MGGINKYASLAIIIIAGYAFFSLPCIFHLITGYPCPTCGTRRSLFALLNGNIYESLLINPYGVLLLSLTAIYLTGIASDLIRKGYQFRSWLKKAEQHLANKYILLPLILLALLNWIWNIEKGL